MKKKLISILIALSLAALTSCGDKNNYLSHRYIRQKPIKHIIGFSLDKITAQEKLYTNYVQFP